MSGANGNPPHLSLEEEEEERRSYQAVINTFKVYRQDSLQKVDKTEIYLNSLPDHHQEMLTSYRMQLLRKRNCIEANYKVILKMISQADQLFNVEEEDGASNGGDNSNCYQQLHKQLKTGGHVHSHTQQQMQKLDTSRVIVTLKQIIRDWSSEGEEERRTCYGPILAALTDYFKDVEDRSEIRVLVPGAGLGRLTYEIAERGFFCEGNEFSFFMLIGANFILNQCLYDNQYTFYPNVHQTTNNFHSDDMTREAKFPDASAIQNPPKGTMNMVAGDFLQVYTDKDYWDCVATSFFIDCANNVIDFIESIFNILKPGGVWINLGPLLYHYADSETENSVEPSFEDLLVIIKTVGFEILTNETDVQTKYTQNKRSMYQSSYSSIFMVCRKPNS